MGFTAREFRSTTVAGAARRAFPGRRAGVRNRGLVDEQVLTGESRPVLKEPGDRILGGTLNLDGDLTIRGDRGRRAGDARPGGRDWCGTLAKSKGRYQRLADRAAGRFVPGRLGDRALRLRSPLGLWLARARALGRAWRSR